MGVYISGISFVCKSVEWPTWLTADHLKLLLNYGCILLLNPCLGKVVENREIDKYQKDDWVQKTYLYSSTIEWLLAVVMILKKINRWMLEVKPIYVTGSRDGGAPPRLRHGRALVTAHVWQLANYSRPLSVEGRDYLARSQTAGLTAHASGTLGAPYKRLSRRHSGVSSARLQGESIPRASRPG